jgi:uncharacterized MAPEG superfamily protein
VLLPAMLRRRETGLDSNAGSRDEPGPPIGKTAGRPMRAESDFFETLPIFAAAILIAHFGSRDGTVTHMGAALYLI